MSIKFWTRSSQTRARARADTFGTAAGSEGGQGSRRGGTPSPYPGTERQWVARRHSRTGPISASCACVPERKRTRKETRSWSGTSTGKGTDTNTNTDTVTDQDLDVGTGKVIRASGDLLKGSFRKCFPVFAQMYSQHPVIYQYEEERTTDVSVSRPMSV